MNRYINMAEVELLQELKNKHVILEASHTTNFTENGLEDSPIDDRESMIDILNCIDESDKIFGSIEDLKKRIGIK